MNKDQFLEQHDDQPAKRLKLTVPVKFKKNYARNLDEGVLKNISLTGAFLDLPQPGEFHLDEKLTITFNVSGRQREVSANVIWSDHSGCGIRFNPFNNRDVQIIDDLMFYVESQKDTRRDVLDSIFKVVA